MSRGVAPLSRLLAPVPYDRRARRFTQLLAGLVGYGVTASMMVLAGLGLCIERGVPTGGPRWMGVGGFIL